MVARLIIFLVFVFAGTFAMAQPVAEGQRNGLLQATASVYPSWMLNHDVRNNYVGGHFAYYFEDQYSFRGDALAYIDAQTEQKYLKSHAQFSAGFGRHFPVNRLAPFIYLQMGLASVQLQSQSRTTVQPVAGTTFGLNYLVSSYFYFFAEGVYMHMQDPSGPGNIDQLYVSGGLGFQFPTKGR